jgi:hypothetical protein
MERMKACFGRLLFLSAVCALPAARLRAQKQPRIAPELMAGTWQIMSVKNLATGDVDSIAKRRTMWTQYTNTRWTYIWTEVNRRALTQYAQVWNGAMQVFWASGGEYWMPAGAREMFYTNVLSIAPWQLQIGSVEHVVSVTPNSYVYRSEPDAQGVVREYTHRRIDFGHPRWPMLPVGGVHHEALQGLWQLMSVRNVSTGQVDDIARRQTIWMHATDSVMMHVWQDKERPVVTPDSLARLSGAPRAEANRAMFADAIGNLRFGAVAGSYRIAGDSVLLKRMIAIDPALEGTTARDQVVRLDRDWYIIRLTSPDGAVRELSYRRLD